ncbi:class I SAM-dependent methyltransferase [uncultured Desulfuromusa sp.]|uniref:class I SAM-dependent methyltransferase n=1 Tax=uncultured Desulfuromusa sp. TaxID=219183 RepID=UPI002AA895CD|nr:class I SAM-dependent methyltransferase [uncultured Desulfuromusa sp.]
MPNIEAFEKYSDAYDDWFEKNPEAYAVELKAVRQLLPSVEAKGLEVGIGSGKFAVPLGIKVGVEPSIRMASKAEKLGLEVYPGVAEELPFPADQFDFVLMVTTICFVDDVVKSFQEAFRVLVPGGCILVGFVDMESELGQKYLQNRHKSRFYQQATFFSTQQVLDHLKTANFEVAEIKQTLIPEDTEKTVLDGFGQGAFVVVKAKKET